MFTQSTHILSLYIDEHSGHVGYDYGASAGSHYIGNNQVKHSYTQA